MTASVLAGLLPPAVRFVELRDDPAGLTLHPLEEAALGRPVPSRRGEFTTGRYCARTALDLLGVPADAVPRGRRGSPQWPPGVVGSITHCTGYRAAAVARTADVRALGIDAEPHAPLPEGVLRTVAAPAERAHLADLARSWPAVAWDTVLFSAKESLYKAWSPVTGDFLDFDGARIRLTPSGGGSGTFVGRLERAAAERAGPPDGQVGGRFAVRSGLVVTAVRW